MISILVDGEDKTGKIVDWTIHSRQGILQLTCHFPSSKTYTRPISACRITPFEEVEGGLLARHGGVIFSPVAKVQLYGGKYAVVHYPGNSKPYVMKQDEITLVPSTAVKDDDAFKYFVTVAETRTNRAAGKDKPIAENVLRQLGKISPHPDTALYAYCTGRNRPRERPARLIYPFGVNQSQLEAVEQAFSSQISLIEGPPGTGKTQTILNIVANILLQQKTVAILSNNNAAVKNVYEKLHKAGLDYLVAQLGSADNRKSFFASAPEAPSQAPPPAPDIHHVDALLQKLRRHLHAHNQLAQLQADIDELRIEQKYLLQWQRENLAMVPAPLDRYGLPPPKIADLMAYLTHLASRRVTLKDRIALLLDFRILRTGPLSDWEKRKSLIYALQRHYYDTTLRDGEASLAACRKELADSNFEALLDELTRVSMAHLKSHLYRHIPRQESFDESDYLKRFDNFVKRYPVIGSSTHSIVNSIADNAVLDYVIIDEASQQDIVPGVLGLGCARNLIVVGDRKQLPHVPTPSDEVPPAEHYDCVRYSLLDSCLAVFGNTVPVTLLKEHYRCHPKIIQFCNKQFYDDQLIPMTRDNGEKPLSLVITAKGNHTRNFTNLRELDSLQGALEWDEQSNRGFIAPYNAQVGLSRTRLPEDFVKSTVHKFQGRECDEIVFSTVLDHKYSSQRNADFVDDPHLVNVAVSRAKNCFTLVTGG